MSPPWSLNLAFAVIVVIVSTVEGRAFRKEEIQNEAERRNILIDPQFFSEKYWPEFGRSEDPKSRMLREIVTSFHAAPEWDLEGRTVQEELEYLLSDMKLRRKLHSSQLDDVTNTGSESWSQDRIVSFLLAAVLHVLESPGLSKSNCPGDSLGTASHRLLEAQKLIIQHEFIDARNSTVQALKLLRKCHTQVSKGKSMGSTLRGKHLVNAIKDGLHKINILLSTLNSIHSKNRQY